MSRNVLSTGEQSLQRKTRNVPLRELYSTGSRGRLNTPPFRSDPRR